MTPTETALRADEGDFRFLAEAIPQIVWITRPDGWNIYFNQRWVEYTGLTLDESHGHGWTKPFHPDDHQRAWEAWQHAIRHEADYSVECRLRCADGSYHWWLIRGAPKRGADGRVLKWFGTCTDIEEIKLAQEPLRESRAKLEAALAAITDAVFISDASGRFVDFNEAFVTFHRFRNRDECAKTLAEYPLFLDVFRPDGSLLPLEQWAVPRALRGETATNQEYKLRRRDTGDTWVGSYSLAPIRDRDGIVVGALITARDITDRKHAEEGLARMSERLALATRAARLGIWDWDVVGDQLVWDDGMYALYGVEKGAFGGAYHAWVRGVHPGDRARAQQETDRALRGDGAYESEFRVVWPDGTVRDLAAQGAVVRDAEGRPLRMIGVNYDVTERKKAEAALRDQQERLRTILDTVGDPIFVKDNEHRIIVANRALNDLFGLAEGAAVGRTMAEHVPEDQLRQYFEVDRRVLDTGQPDIREEVLTLPGRAPRTFITKKTSFVEGSGERFLVGAIHDITSRKEAELENIRARQRLNEAQRIGRIGDWELDPATETISWSPQVFEILGRDPKLGPPRDMVEATAGYDEPNRKRVEENVRRAMDTGLPQEYELVAKRPDGTLVELLARAVPRLDDDGKVHGLYGTVQDITERKLAEQALRERDRKLTSILDILPVGIAVSSADHQVAYMNRRNEEIVGLSAEEVGAMRAADRGPRGAHALTYGGGPLQPEDFPFARVLREHRAVHNEEIGVVKKDGQVTWVDVSAVPLDFPDWKVVTVISDITERRRAEEEIRKLNTDLERRVAQRTAQLEEANAELEAFSYSVSHDLRAPLRAIDGFSRIVQEDYAARLDDEGRDSLSRIRAAAQRMAQLIDDLLKLSRVTRAEMNRQPIDMTALARDVIAELRQRGQDRTLDVVVADGLAAQGDPRLLRVVLENLLGNAWKFTERRERARIEFGAASKDGRPAWFVRDNGAGFDEAHAGKLFGPFQRLHSTAEFAGTGIGLATVQRIVRRHGGRVWAEGTVDHGATLWFDLGDEEESRRNQT